MGINCFWGLAGLMLFLAACSPAASVPDNEGAQVAGEVVTEPAATAEPPPPTYTPTPTEPPPTETHLPGPTATAAIEEPAATLEPTSPPELTSEPEPAEVDRQPILPIGASADWTATGDPIGIEGQIEVTSPEQIVIRDFVFLAAEAPGVDIRLGVDDDFSDGVGVSLKDITGDTYEGRNLTLTLPDEAFDGRSFNSIGVFCFETGDLFDYATFDMTS